MADEADASCFEVSGYRMNVGSATHVEITNPRRCWFPQRVLWKRFGCRSLGI